MTPPSCPPPAPPRQRLGTRPPSARRPTPLCARAVRCSAEAGRPPAASSFRPSSSACSSLACRRRWTSLSSPARTTSVAAFACGAATGQRAPIQSRDRTHHASKAPRRIRRSSARPPCAATAFWMSVSYLMRTPAASSIPPLSRQCGAPSSTQWRCRPTCRCQKSLSAPSHTPTTPQSCTPRRTRPQRHRSPASSSQSRT